MNQVYLEMIDDFIRDGEGGKPVAHVVGELLREKGAEIARLNAQLRDAIQRIGELQMVVDRNHIINVPMRDSISQSEIDGFNKWRERATAQIELDKAVIRAMASDIQCHKCIIDHFTKQAEEANDDRPA